MAKVQSQSTSNPCSISQWASVEALNGPQDFIAERRMAFQERRDHVVRRIGEIEGLACTNPKGAFYVFVNCEELLGKTMPLGGTTQSDVEFIAHLLDHGHVATVPGSAFGKSGHFRISYATSLDAVKEACNRIDAACAALG